ncbi:putative pentatricopeptide repeat-containing protein At5g08310, mitochondrial [Quercus robur]|uniref:putative pentatricopeptide repeat-containing protein At5g08310, mitochondrial n=1 Tax=Quercus robur TaxID=38942 RepID=UPI002163E135|nr:putative pentatricopeptide repeat-containing protein At5g08310, mitochondrial [Quercus robur]
MALPKITEARNNLRKSIRPCALLSLLFTKNLSHTHRPICTKTHTNIYDSSFHSDLTSITNGFISIFTKKPFSPHNPELNSLSPRLTTQVVESVLNCLKSWKIAHMFFTWASNQCGYKHNCYTYNAMASILSRAGQIPPLRAMVMDIVNLRCSMSPGALGYLVRCLGSAGLFDEANVLFDQARRMGLCVPNDYSYNCLLEALSKSNSVVLIEMRMKEMHDYGWKFSKYTLTPVLQVYCNAGKFEKALSMFNDMNERGWVDLHVFSILVMSFSKWGEVDKAFELIERMEDHNITLNEKTFRVLIHGFVKESRVDKALQLFDKMQQSGFYPDVSLYDVLIGGLCKVKELEKALHLFSEMKQLGIHPDVKILTKLVTFFSEEKKMIQLLEEMQEDIDEEAMSLLYNSVLNALVKNNSINKAFLLLKAMMGDQSDADVVEHKLLSVKKAIRPDTTSFSIVIDGLLGTGKLDSALNIFQHMKQIGCAPNIMIYKNLIDGLCNSNRSEESYELFREMKLSRFEPTRFIYNSIYGCLCRMEDVVAALDLVKEMRVYGYEPYTKHSTLLVKGLCKHGRAVEACKFLASMVQEGFLLDIIPYSAAIDGLIKTQEVDRALELFRDICSRGYCPDVVAYNILISGLCKAKRVSEAEDILHEMEVKGLVPSVITYNLLVDGWCKNGDVDQAMLFLSQMFVKDRKPNVITYTTLMNGLCNAGRPDDALVLWNEMGREGCSPNNIAFMALIHGLCKCGRPDTALVYLHQMQEKEMEPDTFVYVALMSSFLCNLNLPLAFEILKEMAGKGNFPDPLDKNCLIVRDAVLKLLEDARTSSRVRNLIAEGRIPKICCSDVKDEG